MCSIQMSVLFSLVCLFFYLVTLHTCSSEDESDDVRYKWPTVFLSILVRNKAHTLPYFLTGLHKLDYPKDRLFVWIYSDYNEDNSVEIIEKWIENFSSGYAGLNFTKDEMSGPLHSDEKSPNDWSSQRFKHVIHLRDEALHLARSIWADFIFMLDADVFLTNSLTLKYLVTKELDIAAPMLLSDGLYSNFWCAMTENFYYKRTEEYKTILNRHSEKQGCFDVPMVHSAVLINMRLVSSDNLTYNSAKIANYVGPDDDIISFAVNAKRNGLSLSICNDNNYGFVPVPLVETDKLSDDTDQLLNIKLEAISRGTPLPLDPVLETYVKYPPKWKFRCDEIYMINLKRRTERRVSMESSFKELGMDVKHFEAVDGRDLDINDLSKFSITLMPHYEDPYHKRSMKAGEVGCFLSHYKIWNDIIEKNHQVALVLEDDIHFVPYFRYRFLQILKDLDVLEWDLVYIGRKILVDSEEILITKHLVRPLYSYWTLGYLISQRGARKLVEAEPLSKMLPVDEYIPIMFGQHPNDTWNSYFSNRNLIAYSATPLLVHPTHYTGEEGYISDTEQSTIMTNEQQLNKNVKHEL